MVGCNVVPLILLCRDMPSVHDLIALNAIFVDCIQLLYISVVKLYKIGLLKLQYSINENNKSS